MNFKKDICRNFQRGSCQYGERCKFLHVSQQQSKPNVFGFGTQNGSSSQQKNTQNQKPNPFGFGVQNSSMSPGPADFGSRQNQLKPFENKWNRNTSTTSSTLRQTDTQSQAAASHKCTDPESCKREIAEDFQNERPLWKLTCYGHRKNGPCDIIGDISFEELRAAAYGDVKNGLSLQSIVERERSLLNTKLIEFENLLRQPYSIPSNSTLSSGRPTPLVPPVAASSSNSSFPQSNAFQNANQTSSGFGANNMAFGKTVIPQIPMSGSSQSPLLQNGFGQASVSNLVPSAAVNSAFPQSNAFQSFGQTSSGFGTNNSVFGKPVLPQTSVPATNPSPFIQNGFGQAPISSSVNNKIQAKDVSEDDKIWLKAKWSRGEIPEEAPPDAYIFCG